MGPSIRIGFPAALARRISFPPSPALRLLVLDQKPKFKTPGLGFPTHPFTQCPQQRSLKMIAGAASGGPGSLEGVQKIMRSGAPAGDSGDACLLFCQVVLQARHEHRASREPIGMGQNPVCHLVLASRA